MLELVREAVRQGQEFADRALFDCLEENNQLLVNSIGMKLVWIPPVVFKMGSPKDENDQFDNDEEQHDVEITKGFYLGIYEVTQEECEKVMDKNPNYFSAKGEGKEMVDGLDTSRFPVEQVSYEDAVKFCEKLSGMAKEKRNGRVYRLPTEAEWEYACRGGASSEDYAPFHFGKSLSSKQANFNGNFPYGDTAKGDYLARTCPVGSYRPNAFGLYDMHGNVWEWCSDWYDEKYYANSQKKDPEGPKEGVNRVLRGGGWYNYGRYCRSAYRNRSEPDSRSQSIGFRLAFNITHG